MKQCSVAMSVIIRLFLVSFLCTGISAAEGCFGYELLVERLENLENRLTNLLATSQDVVNGKINELSKNVEAVNLRISADSIKNLNAINEKINTITSKINDQNSRLEKIESIGKAVVKMLEQSHNGIETKHSRHFEFTTARITQKYENCQTEVPVEQKTFARLVPGGSKQADSSRH